jgi:hypothetical protein
LLESPCGAEIYVNGKTGTEPEIWNYYLTEDTQSIFINFTPPDSNSKMSCIHLLSDSMMVWYTRVPKSDETITEVFKRVYS